MDRINKPIRTREEVKAQVIAKYHPTNQKVIDALVTLSFTEEELLADLRKKHPQEDKIGLMMMYYDALTESIIFLDDEPGISEAYFSNSREMNS